MGTNCAPLVVDLFLFCFERDFMMCLSDGNKLMLLMHLTLHSDICVIFQTLIMFILIIW